MVVERPGCMTIELMAGVGGQHPSRTWTWGVLVIRSGSSPTLLISTSVVMTVFSVTSP
jgi:hypothetical protein